MRRFAVLSLLLCHCSFLDDAAVGLGPQATVLMLAEPMATGSRLDAAVAVCERSLDLNTILIRTAVAAGFTALGRLDAAFALPEALIPGCQTQPYTVESWEIIDGDGFSVELGDDSRTVAVLAESEGNATLRVRVLVDGEVIEAQQPVRALTPTRIETRTEGCESETIFVAAGESYVLQTHSYGGDTRLAGYGVEWVDYSELGDSVVVSDSVLFRAPLTSTTLTVRSDVFPDYTKTIRVFEPSEVTVSGVERWSDADPLFAGERLDFGVEISVDGTVACFDGLLETTSLTPEVCVAEDRTITAVAAGACDVSLVVGEGEQAETNIRVDVRPAWEELGVTVPEGVSFAGVWARGDSDIWFALSIRIDNRPHPGFVHFDGTAFGEVIAFEDLTLALTGISVAGDRAYAYGERALIFAFEDGEWQRLVNPVQGDVMGVWFDDGDHYILVGYGSSATETPILHRGSGDSYERLPVTPCSVSSDPMRLDAFASDDIFVSSSDCGLVHYDGTTWERVIGAGAQRAGVLTAEDALISYGASLRIRRSGEWSDVLIGEDAEVFGTGLMSQNADGIIVGTGSLTSLWTGDAWRGFLSGARFGVPLDASRFLAVRYPQMLVLTL